MLLQGGVIVHVGLLPACLRVVLGVGLHPCLIKSHFRRWFVFTSGFSSHG